MAKKIKYTVMAISCIHCDHTQNIAYPAQAIPTCYQCRRPMVEKLEYLNTRGNDTALILKDIYQRFDLLNEWEQDFIESVEEQLAKHRPLTDKQNTILDRIYDKATENG